MSSNRILLTRFTLLMINKHQQHLSVKAQDYITYTPPVAHVVVLKIGGIPSVMISLRVNAI